jgi:cardiolipin synthase C
MRQSYTLLFIGFFILGGCGSLPEDFPATPSTAVSAEEATTLKSLLTPALNSHPRLSGFYLLDKAEDGFVSRIALADVAEKSIDAQYFIWNGDGAGIILMDRLFRAAKRGVRVRLLLDDITSHGKDMSLGALNSHPNIQIRVFNPLGHRFAGSVSRNIAMAFHIGRMTRRMHNKVFAIDNQVAIVGGRNIADDYFGLSKKSNFRDMDVMASGPVVVDVSSKFDEFWNSPWSIPLEALKVKAPSKKKIEKKLAHFEKEFKKELKVFPYPLDFSRDAVLTKLEALRAQFVWGEAEVVGDHPGKSYDPVKAGQSKSAVAARLIKVADACTKELLIISPYLILSPKTVKGAEKLAKSGCRVRILTNSMMSTDALPVVAKYEGLRESLIKGGVELYEIRPDAENSPRQSAYAEARHSLHAKVSIFDRKDVFVGSFNLDPRSENLNTEVGLLVHSPELSDQVASTIEDDLRPVNSWRVELGAKDKLLWKGEKDGKEIQFKKDPYSSLWTRFKVGFLSFLPISGQL